MPAERDTLNPWKPALAIATLLGLSSVVLIYFGMLFVGRPLTLRHALIAGLPDWYFWAALTPVVFWLGRRYRFERPHVARAVLVHLVVGTVIALTELSVTATFSHFFYQNPYAAPVSYWIDFRTTLLKYFHFAFIIYWMIVTAAHAFGFYQESRRREAESARLSLANAELQARLTQSQLDVLTAQLHPHFLFNALNTVSSVIREQRGEEATALVAELGRLLRQSVGHAGRNEMPLREELGFLESYLTIERARFGDRLRVRFDVDPNALDCLVPAMVLQPLVENAIRHGVQAAAPAGSVWVSARACDGNVVLEVRDDGPGLPESEAAPAAGGERGLRVGLANTRERLTRLYGPGHRFELRNAPDGGGAVATLRIPARRPAAGSR